MNASYGQKHLKRTGFSAKTGLMKIVFMFIRFLRCSFIVMLARPKKRIGPPLIMFSRFILRVK